MYESIRFGRMGLYESVRERERTKMKQDNRAERLFEVNFQIVNLENKRLRGETTSTMPW